MISRIKSLRVSYVYEKKIHKAVRYQEKCKYLGMSSCSAITGDSGAHSSTNGYVYCNMRQSHRGAACNTLGKASGNLLTNCLRLHRYSPSSGFNLELKYKALYTECDRYHFMKSLLIKFTNHLVIHKMVKAHSHV